MESSNSSFLGQTFLACGCSSHCLFLSARRFECELTVWNWNLDVAFLKMQWTDSWIAECLEFFIRSLTENLPLLTLIGPCRKAKITEIRSFLTPITAQSNSTILDHGTQENKLQRTNKRRQDFPICQTHIAFLAVFVFIYTSRARRTSSERACLSCGENRWTLRQQITCKSRGYGPGVFCQKRKSALMPRVRGMPLLQIPC